MMTTSSFSRFFSVLLAATATLVTWGGRTGAVDKIPAGAVFTLTNDATNNQLLCYLRQPSGGLVFRNSISTGGKGAGQNLGSQGALGINAARNMIFAVNAGSDQISTFSLQNQQIKLSQVIDSGGRVPISLTVGRFFVYALNNGAIKGDVDQISGFQVRPRAFSLSPIENSTADLSAANVSPAQVSFDPLQNHLVVTEKATSKIDVFPVNHDGTPGPIKTQPANGQKPYGFAFSPRSTLITSEFGTSSVSSYLLNEQTGALKVVSPSISNGGPGACWVSVTQNGRFAYVSNFDSGTITGFQVGADGKLTPLPSPAFMTPTVGNPIDSAIVANNYLYVLTHFQNTSVVLCAYRIGAGGSLTPIGQITGLPLSTVGIVAY